MLSQINTGVYQTLKEVHSVDRKATSKGTEDTSSQETESSSDIESQHTNETGEEQELLNINNDKQLLTQESVKDNETDQDVGNMATKDKSVAEEPAQQEMGKNVMTMAILTCKQCLLQQRHTGCTMEEPYTGKNLTNHE
eukprot:3758717-Ditylum_brightwellii.AAC.1